MANHDNNHLRSYNGSNHPAPRLLADIHAAIAMNRVIERGRNYLTSDPAHIFYIIDIGAKYAKHASLYYKALFDYSDRVCYIGVRPDLDSYDRRYHKDAEGKLYPHYPVFAGLVRNMQLDPTKDDMKTWRSLMDKYYIDRNPGASPLERVANGHRCMEEELRREK